MEDRKVRLYTALKEQKAASVDKLAEELSVSRDFILGMVEANSLYVVKNGIIMLAGLGTDRCIVCAEDKMEDSNSMKLALPPEFLGGRRLYGDLSPRQIRGHRKCYSTIDLFFRYDGGLACFACASWSGGWATENEVLEECHTLKDKELGHPGVIGENRICNLFSPSYNLKTNPKCKKEKDTWEKLKPEIAQRTQRGHENLVNLLEKAKLLE